MLLIGLLRILGGMEAIVKNRSFSIAFRPMDRKSNRLKLSNNVNQNAYEAGDFSNSLKNWPNKLRN